MTTLTCICTECDYPSVLIYTIRVKNPNVYDEVQAAVQWEREKDVGESANEMAILFAFQGDLSPVMDWRD